MRPGKEVREGLAEDVMVEMRSVGSQRHPGRERGWQHSRVRERCFQVGRKHDENEGLTQSRRLEHGMGREESVWT